MSVCFNCYFYNYSTIIYMPLPPPLTYGATPTNQLFRPARLLGLPPNYLVFGQILSKLTNYNQLSLKYFNQADPGHNMFSIILCIWTTMWS